MPPYTITLCAASTIMLGMRLWLRATKKAGNLGLDDVRDCGPSMELAMGYANSASFFCLARGLQSSCSQRCATWQHYGTTLVVISGTYRCSTLRT